MLFTTSFSENDILRYAGLTADFIKTQRETFAPGAAPLPPDQMEAFLPFFNEGILKTTLFFHKTDGHLQSPAFLTELEEKGVSFPLDRLQAITLQDVVVTFGEAEPRVLFHELVHAVQYQKLGLKQFAYKYMKGLLARGSYERIPLEVNAHALDELYSRDPSQPFSVESEIQRWINENRF